MHHAEGFGYVFWIIGYHTNTCSRKSRHNLKCNFAVSPHGIIGVFSIAE